VKKAVRLEGELLGEMMTMPKKVLDATGVISRPFGRGATRHLLPRRIDSGVLLEDVG